MNKMQYTDFVLSALNWNTLVENACSANSGEREGLCEQGRMVLLRCSLSSVGT